MSGRSNFSSADTSASRTDYGNLQIAALLRGGMLLLVVGGIVVVVGAEPQERKIHLVKTQPITAAVSARACLVELVERKTQNAI